jgi:hypothetical protein
MKSNKTFSDFIIQEIPNIVQITGIPTLFSVLIAKISIFQFVVPIFTFALLEMYLIKKSMIYLNNNNLYNYQWKINIGKVSLLCMVIIFIFLIVGLTLQNEK